MDFERDPIASALRAVENRQIALTETRIQLGSASWQEWCAWHFPRRLGWLHPPAAQERVTGVHPSMALRAKVHAIFAARISEGVSEDRNGTA